MREAQDMSNLKNTGNIKQGSYVNSIKTLSTEKRISVHIPRWDDCRPN